MVNDRHKNDFWHQIPGLKFRGKRSYQVTVALVFGLIGFGVNFLDIEFVKTGDFKISILLGVFFPLLIALAWGWRYGLLCALAGGCQTMWWLWYGDGWGILYSVPVFTLWIVWHGWWADRRSGSSPWYMTAFAVEIPFRIMSELGFMMLFPWLVSLNPPPWDPLLVQDHVSPAWLYTVGIKHTVTAYLFLMVAYVIFSLGPVRRFFGLSSRRAQADTMVIYITAILFGLVLWILNVLTNYFFFPIEGQTFWGLAVAGASPKELFFRSFYVTAALLVGVVIDRVNRRRVKLQERLDHQNRSLAAIRNVNQLIIGEKDPDLLLNEACRLLVETRSFDNAWIALTFDGRPKRPFYHAGFNGGFTPMAEFLLAGDIPACAKALHTSGNIQVEENPSEYCKGCPLSALYAGRAGLCVGLNHADRNFGWLSLSCPVEFAHLPEEQNLIMEMAGDIAFALWAIENENHRKTVESQYAAVLAASVDAVMAFDLNGRITVFNPSAERMFGCTAEDALGSSITRFCPEDRLAEQQRKVRYVHRTGELTGYESERLTADGRRIWVELSMSLSRNDLGRPQGINAILRDISERKKMEKQVQQAQKMEAIGSLAGGIAHDFNNILFPIIGFSQMLMEDFYKESSEYKNVREILTAARRASELVNQILSFSRQSEDKSIPVRFQTIIREVLKLCRSTIPSNIKIHQEINSQCGYIMADPTKLHQVAMNLMTNAYHAIAPAHGEISLKLCEKKFGQEDIPAFSLKPGRYVMLTVSDTGKGIGPDIKNRIFDPYFTTKEKGKGTGLGLSVVHGIIHAYAGEIKVYSEVGQGTTFNVYLPLMETSVEIPTEKKMKINPMGNEHILLVDDEQPIVQMEKTILERLGYHITSHTGSIEALEVFKAKADTFDLVITDMTMPNMTGDQLAKELLAVKPDIPIIILTGFSERISKATIETMGVKGLLMKPVVISDMALEIRRVLDESQSVA